MATTTTATTTAAIADVLHPKPFAGAVFSNAYEDAYAQRWGVAFFESWHISILGSEELYRSLVHKCFSLFLVYEGSWFFVYLLVYFVNWGWMFISEV